MKNATCLVILLSFIGGLTAQSLSGIVIDEQNNPVFLATVALYNAVDSSYVAAASTDNDGNYKLSKLKKGLYFLENDHVRL